MTIASMTGEVNLVQSMLEEDRLHGGTPDTRIIKDILGKSIQGVQEEKTSTMREPRDDGRGSREEDFIRIRGDEGFGGGRRDYHPYRTDDRREPHNDAPRRRYYEDEHKRHDRPRRSGGNFGARNDGDPVAFDRNARLSPFRGEVIPLEDRPRYLKNWDATPPGFERIPADRAKLTGLFPPPGNVAKILSYQPPTLDPARRAMLEMLSGSDIGIGPLAPLAPPINSTRKLTRTPTLPLPSKHAAYTSVTCP